MDILIIAFEAGRWGPARLVRPLRQAGFAVTALCPDDNPLAHTRFLHRHLRLARVRSHRHFARQLAAAMADVRPRLVVPADEQTVACLHAVLRRPPARLTAEMRATLRASLGDPAQHDALLLKSRTQALARRLGVKVPAGGTVGTPAEALAMAARVGYPVYVKNSFSWAGRGVTRCADAEAVAAAMPVPGRQGLRSRLRSLLGRDWFPTTAAVDVQAAITGVAAMYTLVALDGAVLAGFAGWTREGAGANGPSVAVRLGGHTAMAQASARMVAALGASGFLSFDFMIEARSGEAWLLECNPRPNQVGHLGARLGADLCTALADGLRGGRRTAVATGEAEVGLFPQLWYHDPTAAEQAMLDVPWDDPGLLAVMVNGAPDARPRRDDRNCGDSFPVPSFGCATR